MADAALPPPSPEQEQQPQQPHACYLIVHNVSKKHNGAYVGVHTCCTPAGCRRHGMC
jgi:hypothetical protein